MQRWQKIWETLTRSRTTDTDEARQEYTTRLILVMMSVVLSILTCVVIAGWLVGSFVPESVTRILLLDLPVGLAWWLVARGRWRQAGYIPPAITFLQAVYGTYSLGVESLLYFYVLSILLTGLLQGLRAQWFMVVISLVVLLGAGWFHGERDLEKLTISAVTASSYFVAVALLQWLAVSQLHRALAQTRDHAAQLEEYRLHLEERVRERSAELLDANEKLQQEISRHKQAQQDLAQKAEDLSRSHAFVAALNRVTARVESTRDPDRILNSLGEELRSLGLTCVVALRDHEDGALVVTYTSIESALLASAEKLAGIRLRGYRIPRQIPHFVQVVEHRQPLYVSDPLEVTAALLPGVPRAVLKHAVRLFRMSSRMPTIYLPLTIEERVVGAMAVLGAGLQQDDAAPLLAFAGQVASFLESAWLFQAEQRRAVELSILLEVTQAVSSTLDLEDTLILIAEQLTKAVGVDGCTLSRWDQEADAVVTWIEWRQDLERIDEPGTTYALEDFPATRAVLETRQPYTVSLSDPDADPAELAHMHNVGTTSLLMLPLAAGEQVIGLLELDESRREHGFTPAEIRLCQALAGQAAVAIENAQLYESIRRELGERKRAEMALQRAHDQLELRVLERTLELRQVNEALENSLQELKQTQAQLVQAQKMEAMGRLAGGVAHDFNNLLTVIEVSTQFLAQRLHPADPLWEHVQQIREAGRRAISLTGQLLSFSRQQLVELRIVDLGNIVRDLSRMLRRVLGEDIELLTSLADDLWPVRVDPSRIEQVIVNLAVNARDAMPRGGRLSINIENLIVDRASSAQHPGVEPGEYVALFISDTGMGMDDEVKEHIFEPFFTTKQEGKGTGLGLPTVYGVVKQSDGQITVDSQLGEGTTFKIYLPRVEEAATPPQEPSRTTDSGSATGSETILVVEDEEAVLRLAARILEFHGYQVLTAGNGIEALRLAAEQEMPIDLLLTDVVMPGMNGKELAERLQHRHPGLRVLYMSGYSDDILARPGALDRGVGFMPKPFSMETLTRNVRAALDATP